MTAVCGARAPWRGRVVQCSGQEYHHRDVWHCALALDVYWQNGWEGVITVEALAKMPPETLDRLTGESSARNPPGGGPPRAGAESLIERAGEERET